jgi:ATP-independent RNA helicase DbpA
MNTTNLFPSEFLDDLTALGFSAPTPVQKAAMVPLEAGKSVYALAPTGSGKTLAFLLPLLSKVEVEQPSLQMLILTPTRELGGQIFRVAQDVGNLLKKKTDKFLQMRTFFGGQKISNQLEELGKSPQVIIGTPGRVLDLLERNLLDVSALKSMVLDEADLMTGMGFSSQIASICNLLPTSLQMALFSATESEQTTSLSRRFSGRAVRIDLRSPKDADDETSTDENLDVPYLDSQISHEYLSVRDDEDKLPELLKFLGSKSVSLESGIIFCQTRESVQNLAYHLKEAGVSAEALSGEMGQIQRQSVLRMFRSGQFRFLVSTNIASRGIDIRELSVAINYDLPSTKEEYIHRAGRTGRAGSNGWALSLCTKQHEQFFFALVAELGIEVKRRVAFIDRAATEQEVPTERKTFVKLHMNKGKSHKLRPGDIVGAFTQTLKIAKEDVGGIFIFDHFTHVEVSSKVVNTVKKGLGHTKIKNLQIKVTESLS